MTFKVQDLFDSVSEIKISDSCLGLSGSKSGVLKVEDRCTKVHSTKQEDSKPRKEKFCPSHCLGRIRDVHIVYRVLDRGYFVSYLLSTIIITSLIIVTGGVVII